MAILLLFSDYEIVVRLFSDGPTLQTGVQTIKWCRIVVLNPLGPITYRTKESRPYTCKLQIKCMVQSIEITSLCACFQLIKSVVQLCRAKSKYCNCLFVK